MTKSVEKLQTAANGRENSASGGVALSEPALVYAWDDPAFKSNPTQKWFFRLSVNIAHDLGISGALNANIIKALERLGAVRSVGDNGKPSGKVQNNPDNPTGITARGQGFFVPPRVQYSEAGDAGDAVSSPAVVDETTATPAPEAASKPKRKRERKGIRLKDTADSAPNELALVERGEDGQPLVREVGEFVGTDATVVFNCNYGAEVETAEATTAPPETPKAEEFPEFGSVDFSRVVGSVVNLAEVVKPEHLVGYSSALAEASAKVRSLGAPETLVAAVSYAAMGWRVFPLAENTKVPVKDSHGFKDATSEVSQLVNWFDDGEFFQKGGNPRRNLGIATGETDAGYDLVALDVDVKNGKNGFLVFGWAVGEFGELPATLMASTPSGGLHYLFKAPMGSNIGSNKGVFKQHGDGLDIRGRGGMVVAAPTMVGGKSYQWLNDLLPAWLPDSWVTALQAECPAGGKRGAVSGSSNGDGERVTRGELLPMPEYVAVAIAKHAVPSDVGRTDWLKVLSVLSAYDGGEALARVWSSTGNYAKRFNDADFDKAWDEVHGGFNGGVPMSVGALFNLVKEHSPAGQTPAARRTLEQEVAGEEASEQEGAFGAFGVMPDHLKNHLKKGGEQKAGNGGAVLDAVSDEEARRVLGEFIAVGKAAPEGSEAQFIAGMLLMDDGMIMPHVRKHPTRTKSSELRGIVRYADGSKPDTAESIDWERVKPSMIWGGSDMVTRLANNIKAKLSGGIGVKGRLPNAREYALVRGVVEVSAYSLWVREAVKTGEAPNGWNLESIITQGLSRADGAPEQGTGLASSVSGNVLPEQPSKEHGGALAWLRELYAIPWGGTGLAPAEPVDYAMPLDGGVPWVHWKKTKQGAYPTCTPENVGVLLALYGHRVRWNDMRYRVEYEGFPCDPGMDDEAFKHVKALTARNNLGWKDQDVSDMMSAWASHWRFHPAKEWIESKPWDGVSRIVAFADTVTVQKGQRDNWLMYFRRWALGAIHALYSSTGGASKHALVLHGEQSKGKTSWFRTLAGGQVEDSDGNRLGGIPVLKEGVMLNVKDKDSVAETVTWWLVELGELEATYSTKQLAELKAFTTKQQDEWRAPFDRKSNTHRRRTAFVGTVNGDESLADYGGNTRWATVTVGRADYQHDVDAQQMWAEVLHIWKTGTKEEKRHWLTKEEEAAMERQNDQYVARGGFYDRLALMFDWKHPEWVRWAEWARKGDLDDNPEPEPNPAPPCIPNGRLHEVMGFTTDRPPKPSDKNEISAALKKLGAVKYRNNEVRGFYLPVCATTDAYKGTTKGSYIK